MPTFQIIFFVIGLLCSLPVLFWYYRRHPNARFRPRFGEMAMVSLFAVLLSLGGSMLIGGLMDDPERLKDDGGLSTMPGMPSEGGGDESESEKDGGGSSRKSEGRGGSSRGGESNRGGGR